MQWQVQITIQELRKGLGLGSGLQKNIVLHKEPCRKEPQMLRGRVVHQRQGDDER